MSSKWVSVGLGDLARKRTDFTPVDAETEYEVVGVQRSGWGLVHREPVRGDSMKFSKLMQLEKGNLVYRTITAFEAPSAVVGPEDAGSFVTPQAFPVFRLDETRILPAYMSLLTTFPKFHQAMSERCTGTVLRRKTLAVGAFLAIPIQLPPLFEQQRIVDLIGALDGVIEATQAHSLATISVHQDVLTSQLNAGSGTQIPLESVFEHIIGGSWGNPPGEDEQDVIALGPSAYAADSIEVNPHLGSARSLSKKRADVRSLSQDDIVLERSGGSATQPVGRVLRMRSDVPYIVPSDFMRLLRVNKNVADPSFVFWTLWSLYRSGASLPFQKFTTGIRNLNIPDYLRSCKITLPEENQQRRIAELGESLHRTAEAVKEQTESLRFLRTELLASLLSGTHRIPETYDELMGA